MDFKGKLVFVCGPTWGCIDMNRPALEEAGRKLRNRGADTLVMEVCDPNGPAGQRHDVARRNVHALTGDFEGAPMVDALVCLPKSEGTTECMFLREVALRSGIPITSLERALS